MEFLRENENANAYECNMPMTWHLGQNKSANIITGQQQRQPNTQTATKTLWLNINRCNDVQAFLIHQSDKHTDENTKTKEKEEKSKTKQKTTNNNNNNNHFKNMNKRMAKEIAATKQYTCCNSLRL